MPCSIISKFINTPQRDLDSLLFFIIVDITADLFLKEKSQL